MSAATILIVDDEADVRGLVREILTRAGYEVLEAADGQEGLRAFYAGRPELVLLDVSMPVLDGWATLARIRELSEAPVIMLTARGEELQRVRGLRRRRRRLAKRSAWTSAPSTQTSATTPRQANCK